MALRLLGNPDEKTLTDVGYEVGRDIGLRLLGKKEDTLTPIMGSTDLPYIKNYIKANEGFTGDIIQDETGQELVRAKRDSRGNLTIGRGHKLLPGESTIQPRQAVEQKFDEDFDLKLNDVKRILPDFDTYDKEAQAAIVDGFFRGDLSGSPKTLKFIKEGKWEEASREYLNHDEFRRAASNGNLGVVKRMQRNADVFKSTPTSDENLDLPGLLTNSAKSAARLLPASVGFPVTTPLSEQEASTGLKASFPAYGIYQAGKNALVRKALGEKIDIAELAIENRSIQEIPAVREVLYSDSFQKGYKDIIANTLSFSFLQPLKPVVRKALDLAPKEAIVSIGEMSLDGLVLMGAGKANLEARKVIGRKIGEKYVEALSPLQPQIGEAKFNQIRQGIMSSAERAATNDSWWNTIKEYFKKVEGPFKATLKQPALPEPVGSPGFARIGKKLYHGTDKAEIIKQEGFDIKQFSTNAGSSPNKGKGFYFSDSPSDAGAWGGIVLEFKNKFPKEAWLDFSYERYEDQWLGDKHIKGDPEGKYKEPGDARKAYNKFNAEAHKAYPELKRGEAIARHAMDQGYIGIKNTIWELDDAYHEYIVFDANKLGRPSHEWEINDKTRRWERRKSTPTSIVKSVEENIDNNVEEIILSKWKIAKSDNKSFGIPVYDIYDEQRKLHVINQVKSEAEKLVKEHNSKLSPKEGGTKSLGAAGQDIEKSEVPLADMPDEVTVRTMSGERKTIRPKDDENFSIVPIQKPNGKVSYQLHDGEVYDIDKNVAQNLIGNYGKKQAAKIAMPEGVEEVVKGNELSKELDRIGKLYYEGKITTKQHDAMIDELPTTMTNQGKFSQYQLPGGENYREVLITAPSGHSADQQRMEELITKKNWTPSERAEVKALEKKIGTIAPARTDFKSSHWDEPNVLAHLRLNDRTTPDGKKVLFVEELQSDWARKAREIQNDDDIKHGNATPQHFLLKNWQELALKRVLKEAVDGGYDYISWTTGEQQAERYDLQKQGIKGITYSKNDDGTFNITAFSRDGKEDYLAEFQTPKELEKIIGKDLTNKIVIKAKSKEQTLQGLDLTIGAEWAKNLYDRQVPNILKDLTKGEVENVNVGSGKRNLYIHEYSGETKPFFVLDRKTDNIIKKFETWDKATKYIDKISSAEETTQPALKITPELKEVMLGPKYKSVGAAGGKIPEGRLPTSKVKRTIRKETGQTKDEELRNLEAQLEAEERASKGGYRQARIDQKRPSFGLSWTPQQRSMVYRSAMRSRLIYVDFEGKAHNNLKRFIARYPTSTPEQLVEFMGMLSGGTTPPKIPNTKALVPSEWNQPYKDLTAYQAAPLSGLDPIRAAELVDGKTMGPVRKFIVEPARVAERTSKANIKQSIDSLNKVSKNMSSKSEESAVLFRFIEQRSTQEDLQKITPKIIDTANFISQEYDKLLNELNQIRVTYGKAPIPKRTNYITHLQELSLLDDMFQGLSNIPDEAIKNLPIFIKPNSPFFKFALRRLGGPFKEDAIEAFRTYIFKAYPVINNTPIIRQARALAERLPNGAYKYFTQYIDEVLANRTVRADQLIPKTILRGLSWVRNKLGKGAILGNIASIANQPFTLPNITSSAGVKFTAKAVVDLFKPGWREFVEANSKILQSRQYEIDFDPNLLKSADNALGFLMSQADREMVRIAFSAGFQQALAEGKGIPGAIEFADDMAFKTQSGFNVSELPPAFRSKFATSFLQFQNTVNNGLNYMKFDLGKDATGGRTKMSIFKAALTFIGTLLALNKIYEVLGIPGPIDGPLDYVPLISMAEYGPPVTYAGPMALISLVVNWDDPRKRGESLSNLRRIGWLTFSGGNQLRKTVAGIEAAIKEGKYNKKGKRMFPVKGALEKARAIVFGPYQTKAGQKYIHNRNQPKTKATKLRLI